MTPNYSVRVKNGSGWRKYNSIRLQISVGQPYHEDNKMRAVVDWIDRNPCITNVTVSVNDDLQRHSLIAQGYTPLEAASVAHAAGALWLARNQDFFDACKSSVTFKRWQDWWNTNDWKQAVTAFDKALADFSGLRDAFDADSHWIVNQKTKHEISIQNPDYWVECSRDYVREEMAVFAIQAAQDPAAEVYPGRNLVTAEWFSNHPPVEGLESLAQRYFTRIDFARISAAANDTDRDQVKSA